MLLLRCWTSRLWLTCLGTATSKWTLSCLSTERLQIKAQVGEEEEEEEEAGLWELQQYHQCILLLRRRRRGARRTDFSVRPGPDSCKLPWATLQSAAIARLH